MNDIVFDFFGINETLSKVSDILLLLTLVVLGGFALMGLLQLIKRKSLKKVDAELTAMIPSLVLTAAIYYVFDKIWVLSYRPVLINGVAESSFPSTHTMVVVTVLGMVMLALPKYIKNKKTRIAIDLVMLAVMGAVAFCRVASGMHWMTDVLGGVVFGADLALLYGGILRVMKERRHE